MPLPIKWTPDFELLNAENPEGHPWLSASPDGRFSLLFYETLSSLPIYTDLEERIFTAAGTAPVSIGSTFSSATVERQPATAYTADGRRIVVWTEAPTAGGGDAEDVYAAVYYGNNVVAQPRFLVSGGAGAQVDPVVAASGSGFVIAINDGSVAGGQLLLKFFSIAGILINTVNAADGGEGVNQSSTGVYRDVEITVLTNGNYVVTWADNGQFDIFARVFSPLGIALSGNLDVDPGGTQATFPDVTALADGRFVITYGQYSDGTVRGHIYEADGTSAGSPFTIATTALNDVEQQVQTAALQDGRFVTVWVNTAGNIEGRLMFADGTPDGTAFAVNSDGAGGKGRPSIAVLADGRFAVSWESGIGAAGTIFTTIFDPREAGINLVGTTLGDDFIGSGFADTIATGAGNDRIDGAGGSDRLFGGTGADTMIGGNGSDTFYADVSSDLVTETNAVLATGGNDIVIFTGASGTFTLGANIERLTLGGISAINGTGNALANLLTGNAKSNLLNGGLGNDTMLGGAGNDTYVVNATGDRVFETTTTASLINAGGIDTVQSAVSFNLNASAGVRFVERLTLTGTANINGTGNALANILTGNAGNNVLNGGLGNDTMLGGLGNDTMLGGAGNDIYVVNTSADRVFETTTTASLINAGGIDTVQSEASFNLNASAGVSFVERLTLTGTANVNGTGNALANILTGNAGNNVLNGGLGNDTMLGGLGNDTMIGGAGNDTFVFSTAPSALNVDRINDFNAVADTIRLDDSVFAGLATGTLGASAFARNLSGFATDALDRIIYETDTGRVYFDADGNGAGAGVHFATLTANLVLTNADFFVF